MNSDETQGNGRVALVTGASRGIGAAVAQRLLDRGYRVAATSRSGHAPQGALAIEADVTDPSHVDAAFARVEQEYGPVEVLVSNAGVTKDTLLVRMTDEDWSGVIDTNLTGSFLVVRRAARSMMRKRFGRIVLIGSVVAGLGSPGQVNYAASKAGLIGVARSVARELGGRGVTCNVVAPGFIATDMTRELGDELRAEYLRRIPAGRLGEVDDVANAVEFLCADASGYLTGAVLPVDGGMGMGR
ncbi:3-oxoacyl-[acyl-carrier protein] reductase [Propionibacterium cyclohexanicum]|uniref:3-oxoacyl-[acyl-carrier protein] reductase n=1 Tax=Propionibacterium cyclohexanicum TaxID=64702 RepID=A0A1H9PM36_9ACTN|nr:beta-ketoacyl-ACP reductase [Propionibacterium cyclohexanicum]SER49272.1 3-oxoacyl-[acyl-carrier protein] reductase [Propionibacterium cyclohexanicum]